MHNSFSKYKVMLGLRILDLATKISSTYVVLNSTGMDAFSVWHTDLSEV